MSRHVLQGKTILVADGNVDAGESLAALLSMSGHTVVIAYDGEAALAEFLRTTPWVVFLDLGMPKMSGYEVAKEIRKTPRGQDALLVALSGWGSAQAREASAQAGFDLHLTKPYEFEQIERLIVNAFQDG